MLLLPAIHAIAAQRGDGLRPELVHFLEQSRSGETDAGKLCIDRDVNLNTAESAISPPIASS